MQFSALLRENLTCKRKALSALYLATARGIGLMRAFGPVLRGFAQIFLADIIATAHNHRCESFSLAR